MKQSHFWLYAWSILAVWNAISAIRVAETGRWGWVIVSGIFALWGVYQAQRAYNRLRRPKKEVK